MFTKKTLRNIALLDIVVDILIAYYIIIINKGIDFLPAFIMGVLYLCVGMNDWHFRYPKNQVGAAINGWLMTFAALLGFFFVNNAIPHFEFWTYMSLFTALLNIPAMIHPYEESGMIH